jgi:hypothetical protein
MDPHPQIAAVGGPTLAEGIWIGNEGRIPIVEAGLIEVKVVVIDVGPGRVAHMRAQRTCVERD